MNNFTAFTRNSFIAFCSMALIACQPESTPPESPDQVAGNKAEQSAGANRRPNVLLIVVDDMGMADVGAFGSEIETPHLDKLAMQGIRLTNFTVAPTCSPTRAMLLTGSDSHIAGLGNMLEETSPNQKGKPGYEGYLNNRVVTMTELLRDAGYRTYLSGKWHLGGGEESRPTARGFQKSFSLIAGGASHWPDMRPAYAPTPDVKASYFENGSRLDKLPADFIYSSQFYVDRLIDYLDEGEETGQPFFAMLSFTAPHWPLQAPDHAIEKYRGRYDGGYDELLQRRYKRQVELGIVSADTIANIVPRSETESGPAWDSLSEQQQRESARAMEVYAAMVDQVDVHVGRLINHLEKSGQLENTMIVFMSDNGAEAHSLDETWPKDLFPKIRQTIDQTHDFSYENMGKPNSYVLYGRGWGRAGTPAYRLHKAFPTEGGMRVAAFVHFPQMFGGGSLDGQQYEIRDIAPTVLALAGVEHPDIYNNRPVKPMTGISLLPYWQNPDNRLADRVQVFELFGKRMVKQYPWKLVHMAPPYGSGEWQLYNLQYDSTESLDRAADYPDIVARLVGHWEAYVVENGVILPDWVSGY